MAEVGARSARPVPAQEVSAAEPHVDGLRAMIAFKLGVR
jgi:hypothetical protein